MTGALIGAAATYLYMHNDDKLTTATRRIKAKSKGALNRVMEMGQEAEELF
jgi:hypothetical protein